jgi:hypothetical protein
MISVNHQNLEQNVFLYRADVENVKHVKVVLNLWTVPTKLQEWVEDPSGLPFYQ